MRGPALLVLLAALLGAETTPALGQTGFARPAPGGKERGMSAEKREALRQTLLEYHTHLVADELQLNETDARRLTPKLEALFELGRDSNQERRRLLRSLYRSVTNGSSTEAAQTVARLTALDLATATSRDELRDSFLGELTVRQQAVYLAHEDAFRQRVIHRVRAGRQSAPGEKDRIVPDSMEPGRAMPQRERQPGPSDSPRSEGREDRLETLTEELFLRFLLRFRKELKPEPSALATLLSPLEDLVGAQVEARSGQQKARRRLKRALRAEDSVSESSLKALIQELLASQRQSRDRALTAQAEVLKQLDALDSARFLLLSESFARQAGQSRGPHAEAPQRRGGGPAGRRKGRPGGRSGRRFDGRRP